MNEEILIDLGRVSEETKGPIGGDTESVAPFKRV